MRLVCVSNRIAVPGKAATPSGLTVGVQSALKRSGGVWVGWGGELADHDPRVPRIHVRDGITYVGIELRRDEFHRCYDGFANEAIRPLFHDMAGKFRFRPEERESYESVNRQFSSRIRALLKPTDVVWVHDFPLIPLARCLREFGVSAPIGFFLHTPFPYIETLRVLPTHAELVRDLACYDVLGFQTQSDLRSFFSAAEHVFGTGCVTSTGWLKIGGRKIQCDVFPIGVDVDDVQRKAAAASASEGVRRMIDSLRGRKLLIGVDRLDYSKGVAERFAAYERFLERFPENCRRVTYLQIAPLSRRGAPSHAELRCALEQAAGRTNGRFADTDWTPIRYLNRNVAHGALMGLLRAARVGLVTPLRDGMNLVAKEYLAAQDLEAPGVLVLSDLAGAARELAAAIQINPYDPDATGRAIQAALHMSLGERRERHCELVATLRENSVGAWRDRFLMALNSVRHP